MATQLSLWKHRQHILTPNLQGLFLSSKGPRGPAASVALSLLSVGSGGATHQGWAHARHLTREATHLLALEGRGAGPPGQHPVVYPSCQPRSLLLLCVTVMGTGCAIVGSSVRVSLWLKVTLPVSQAKARPSRPPASRPVSARAVVKTSLWSRGPSRRESICSLFWEFCSVIFLLENLQWPNKGRTLFTLAPESCTIGIKPVLQPLPSTGSLTNCTVSFAPLSFPLPPSVHLHCHSFSVMTML